MTSSENFGNKINYLFKRMNSFLSFKKNTTTVIYQDSQPVHNNPVYPVYPRRVYRYE